MLREGYIERAIQRLAAAVARAAGLREAGNAKEALEELRDAKANLPVVPGVLDVLSPRDLRRALGSDEVVVQFIDSLRQEAPSVGVGARGRTCAAPRRTASGRTCARVTVNRLPAT